jgi:phosphoglycolate phosphatase-like HAD superfamily hydrolase
MLPAQEIKAIFFDLDGTLLDTDKQAMVRIARYLRPIARQRGEPLARWLLMRAETPGNVLMTLIDSLNLDQTLLRLSDRLRRWRGVYPAHEFYLISGVAEALICLGQRYRLGLVTTRSRYHIDQFLARFSDIGPLIEVSCGMQDSPRLKPHPAPVLLAAKRLGLTAKQCLMVGDTTVDVRAARRAGAWSAAVLSGFGERTELERAGAHVILNSVAELPSCLGLLPFPPPFFADEGYKGDRA